MTIPHAPKPATLEMDGYAGRTSTPVEVIGETATKYRIRAVRYMRLGGRGRYLMAHEVALVPKHAIRFSEVAHV